MQFLLTEESFPEISPGGQLLLKPRGWNLKSLKKVLEEKRREIRFFTRLGQLGVGFMVLGLGWIGVGAVVSGKPYFWLGAVFFILVGLILYFWFGEIIDRLKIEIIELEEKAKEENNEKKERTFGGGGTFKGGVEDLSR